MARRALGMMGLISILLLFGYGIHSSADDIRNREVIQLREIIHVMHHQHVKVKKWGLYAKRNSHTLITKKEYGHLVFKIQQEWPSFKWNRIHKDKEGNLKITGVNINKKTGIHERFTLIAYPESEKWRSYEVYEVSGDHWEDKNWKAFSPTFHKRLRRDFPGHPLVFSSASGTLHSPKTANLKTQAKQFLRVFSAKPVEGLKEETFVSISAYTNQWKSSIQTNDQLMNLQVALRRQGEGRLTTVTIGTPIITTEY